MKSFIQPFRLVLASTCVLIVTACAGVNPDPCSKSAIEYRLGQSLNSFAKANRGDINEVKSASQYFGGESVNGAMKLAFALRSLQRLSESFGNDVVPDIQAISNQCGGVQPVREVFVDFLKDEGVNKKVISWVEGMSIVFDTQQGSVS